MTSFSMLVHFFESTEPLNVIIINIENKFILDTTLYGRIQEGAKLFANVEGQKLHKTKIILYTVVKLQK